MQNVSQNLHSQVRGDKMVGQSGSAAPSDCLLLGAAYKCTYLLTYREIATTFGLGRGGGALLF